jgi:uncharacterized protein YybS (DUF2232 family)
VERDLTRKVPVSVTLDRQIYDLIDDMIARRVFKDRSHAVNAALDFLAWTLKNNPSQFYGDRSVQQSPPTRQQQPGTNPRYPR